MKPEDEQEVEEGGESGVTVSERVLILFLCYSKGVVKARPIRGPGGGVKARSTSLLAPLSQYVPERKSHFFAYSIQGNAFLSLFCPYQQAQQHHISVALIQLTFPCYFHSYFYNYRALLAAQAKQAHHTVDRKDGLLPVQPQSVAPRLPRNSSAAKSS